MLTLTLRGWLGARRKEALTSPFQATRPAPDSRHYPGADLIFRMKSWPQLPEDGRTADIDGAIGEWAATHELEAIVKALEAADVPHGKIYTAADIVADPQYLAREMIRQVILPDGTALKLPGIVPKLSDTPGAMKWVGPRLGEHTDEVLRGIGYSDEDIARLRATGVI